MSDTKSGDDKTLSVSTKKTLTLKRSGVEQSTVRQSFSHGRTNNVVEQIALSVCLLPCARADLRWSLANNMPAVDAPPCVRAGPTPQIRTG